MYRFTIARFLTFLGLFTIFFFLKIAPTNMDRSFQNATLIKNIYNSLIVVQKTLKDFA